MPKMVKLIAPSGTDESNFGTVRYRVHDVALGSNNRGNFDWDQMK